MEPKPETGPKPPDTARELERYIIDVGMGRIRLGLTPDQIDEHLQQQFRRLQALEDRG